VSALNWEAERARSRAGNREPERPIALRRSSTLPPTPAQLGFITGLARELHCRPDRPATMREAHLIIQNLLLIRDARRRA